MVVRPLLRLRNGLLIVPGFESLPDSETKYAPFVTEGSLTVSRTKLLVAAP